MTVGPRDRNKWPAKLECNKVPDICNGNGRRPKGRNKRFPFPILSAINNHMLVVVVGGASTACEVSYTISLHTLGWLDETANHRATRS